MSTLTSSGWKIQHKNIGKGRRGILASVKKVLPLYPVPYLESEHTCTLAQHCSCSPALQICMWCHSQSLLRLLISIFPKASSDLLISHFPPATACTLECCRMGWLRDACVGEAWAAVVPVLALACPLLQKKGSQENISSCTTVGSPV